MTDTLTTMLPLAWLHDLDPFLWEISPGFGVRWYGLSYVAGFVIGWLVLRELAKRSVARIEPDRTLDMILLSAVLMVVGGRLGYILIYQPSLLWTFSNSPPWWGALAINQGGMASHGGMVGLAVAAIIIARSIHDRFPDTPLRQRTLHVLDLYALIGPFGIALGRLANFINGELLGRIASPAGQPAPWYAVKFAQEVIERPRSLSPDQVRGLHEALSLPAPIAQDPGSISDPDLWHPDFEQRFDSLMGQLQAGSEQAARILEPWINARHPSQLYQAVAEGIVTGIVVWLVARKPRKPGVLASGFFVTYGLLRIATEFWRLPDAHLNVQRFAGLSRGQWLSTIMIVVGIWILLRARRAACARIGGWATQRRGANLASSESR